MNVFCGIDWAEGQRDIALVNAEGRLVAKRRITETIEGFAELTMMLAQAGDSAEDPIPVAIETPRGLLVAALRASGRKVYPITRWRWPATGNGTARRGKSPTTQKR